MIVWLEGADGAVGEVGDEATSCWRMFAYAYDNEMKINQADQETGVGMEIVGGEGKGDIQVEDK
jgi:hypothetical protein